TITIDGTGGQSWQIDATPDAPPAVSFDGPIARGEGGQVEVAFVASDDYGVTAGTMEIALDVASVDRHHGLTIDPEDRAPLVLDLPMPIAGDRTEFEELLVEDLSEHSFANLPVTVTLNAFDAIEQSGLSEEVEAILPGRRFFDPLAKAVIEQRRDLLWNRANAPRVAQLLRAVSHRPEDIFRSETTYLKLRFLVRRLETRAMIERLDDAVVDEIATALWDLAIELEEGDLGDALERLRRAQDRLSEAMENGASDEEIAELMQELREAMQDYMRQLAEQQSQDGEMLSQQDMEGMEQMDGQQMQDMLDRIQELMEQGRMAEAQQLLDQLRQMMENMRIAEGQPGQQSQGQQAMEGLAETLREQQGLSDEAFQDLQEQFNPNGQQGQQGQQGQPGQQSG
ncbi:MAG: DUF4175 family protein, partial [Planctomycetota bacterium]